MNIYTITPPTKDELTPQGFTNKIKINKNMTADKLLKYGFTNHYEPSLYFSTMIIYNDISFNLRVSKKTLKITDIDVLDENLMQPYDYQAMIMDNKNHTIARKVFDKVDEILNKLQNDGIIVGYQRGMYV